MKVIRIKLYAISFLNIQVLIVFQIISDKMRTCTLYTVLLCFQNNFIGYFCHWN